MKKQIVIKLPFKHELLITSWFIALYYLPNGTDKKEPLLLARNIWSINIPFTKKPKGVLWVLKDPGADIWNRI